MSGKGKIQQLNLDQYLQNQEKKLWNFCGKFTKTQAVLKCTISCIESLVQPILLGGQKKRQLDTSNNRPIVSEIDSSLSEGPKTKRQA